eukprot:TRINITY_DN3780_c0_g1_i1.p1 TRINITY_DN3780_c0_g1~~TRINITY_DN3780_c0_g1_i1.p1  ORF type:complete len:241 (-),score=67.05 TRINITY_DN3780_c0_g1_i1:40-762(-)
MSKWYVPPSLWQEISVKLTAAEREAARLIIGSEIISQVEELHTQALTWKEMVDGLLLLDSNYAQKQEIMSSFDEEMIRESLLTKIETFVELFQSKEKEIPARFSSDKKSIQYLKERPYSAPERPESSLSSRQKLSITDLERCTEEIRVGLRFEKQWLNEMILEMEKSTMSSDETSVLPTNRELKTFLDRLESEWNMVNLQEKENRDKIGVIMRPLSAETLNESFSITNKPAVLPPRFPVY